MDLFDFLNILSGVFFCFLAQIYGSAVEREVRDPFGLISCNFHLKRPTGYPKHVKKLFSNLHNFTTFELKSIKY